MAFSTFEQVLNNIDWETFQKLALDEVHWLRSVLHTT